MADFTLMFSVQSAAQYEYGSRCCSLELGLLCRLELNSNGKKFWRDV